MVKFFQRFISGDGYLVFKSSLAPLQSLSSSFQRVIYGDGNVVFKPSPLACFREMVQPFLYPEITHWKCHNISVNTWEMIAYKPHYNHQRWTFDKSFTISLIGGGDDDLKTMYPSPEMRAWKTGYHLALYDGFESKSSVNLSQFKIDLATHNSFFDGMTQRDAHECFVSIVNILHEGTKIMFNRYGRQFWLTGVIN